ncbi:MAG: DUF4838 domain-containing protein [Clostridia bacterium]|nr:DUF4838 domain-containing protein [Clostridia bacterium]
MRKLIVKGKEFSAVQVQVGEDIVAQHAASEFIKYMGKMGIPEGEGLNVKLYRDENIGIDGYRISIVDENTIELVGDCRRGMMYAVYDFLRIYAGARFFTPTIETLGEGDIVVDKDTEYVPAFEIRDMYFPKYVSDTYWATKNHISCSIKPEFGKSAGSYSAGGIHTMEQITGVPQDSQPCLSDPEVLKKAIAWVRGVIEKNPNARSVSVTQNDNVKGYCTCERCAAIDAEEESHAGTLLRFVNAIAEDVCKDYPDMLIETFAYYYTQKAPKITKAHPNVYIRICSMCNCFSHAINDSSCPANRQFHKDIDDWYNVVGIKRMHVWDYVANFAGYVHPNPNFITIRDNMRYYAEHNVKQIGPQGAWDSRNFAEFGELRFYLLAQLMWNPYMDAAEYYRHMDEFLAAYYGEGWRYIRYFIDWICSASIQNHVTLNLPPFEIIARDKWEGMLETCEMWWNKALEMAGDKAENVRISMLQWEFMKLQFHPDPVKAEEYINTVEANDIAWSENYFHIRRDRMAQPPEDWFKE